MEILQNRVSSYNAENVFYLKETARWSYIVKHASSDDITVIIDQAMADIEDSNPALKGAVSKNLYATHGADKSKLKHLFVMKQRQYTIICLNYSTNDVRF